MRTLGLAVAVSLCLGTSAAHALCTTGVECIRERFGVDQTVRNNRIIDRTDRLGDRGRPENPYLAGQNVTNQARRAGRFDATGGAAARGGYAAGDFAADPLRGGETRPDVRYTPGTAVDPYSRGSLIPGQTPSELQDLTVAPYEPAQPVTGDTRAPGAASVGTPRGIRSAPPAQRDRNTPQESANRRYTGPQTSGSYR